MTEEAVRPTMKGKIKVAVKYFWEGSTFYSGGLAHCVALPLEPVPKEMKEGLKNHVVPHFRFSPVPGNVRQTLSTLPGRVCQPGNEWHEMMLVQDSEVGFWFEDLDPLDGREIPNLLRAVADRMARS